MAQQQEGIDWAAPQWSVVANVIVIALLFAFDKLFSSSQARWFSVHAFANFLVVITGFNAVIATLTDPIYALNADKYADSSVFGTGTPWPTIITNSVHIYHMLAFDLTSGDYFHHLLFIPTVGALGQYYRCGAIRGFLGFMLSGFPGGLDYFNLVLVKHGVMDLYNQKRYCAAINIWIRGPFLVIAAFVMYQALIYGHNSMPWPALLLVGGLAAFNAQYYTKQSVANFAIEHSLGHVKERVSVTTGMSVPDWKTLVRSKTIKEPQNTMS